MDSQSYSNKLYNPHVQVRYEIQYFLYALQTLLCVTFICLAGVLKVGYNANLLFQDQNLYKCTMLFSHIGIILLSYNTNILLYLCNVIIQSILLSCYGSHNSAYISAIVFAGIALVQVSVFSRIKNVVYLCVISMIAVFAINNFFIIMQGYLKHNIYDSINEITNIGILRFLFFLPHTYIAVLSTFQSNLFMMIYDILFIALSHVVALEGADWNAVVTGIITVQCVIFTVLFFRQIAIYK